MKIIKRFTVNAPADRVWQIIGPDYAKAGEWASSVYRSAAKPGEPTLESAPCTGRVCMTSLGPFSENLVDYQPKRRYLAYTATGDKMPGFMRSLRNSWDVR
ncbi:MAG: SRPBCC family protein, partial [Pseudomonadota bacterium]